MDILLKFAWKVNKTRKDIYADNGFANTYELTLGKSPNTMERFMIPGKNIARFTYSF